MSDQALRTFQENQRLVGSFEGKFLGVIGVVKTEGKNGSWLDGWKPDHGIFGDDAAIGQTQAAVVFGGMLNRTGVSHSSGLHSNTTSFSIGGKLSISTSA